MIDKEKKKQEYNQNSDNSQDLEILREKERFYAEEDISPEVKEIFDNIFGEMISSNSLPNLNLVQNEESSKEDVNFNKNMPKSDTLISNITQEKEKLYLEEDISPEVREILDETFEEMILEEEIFNNKKDKEQKKDLIINQNEYKEEIDKDQVIKEDFSVILEEYSKKIEDLENMKAIYEEKIEDFEKQSIIAEEIKQDYQNRFIKLEESREEYKKRGEKLENARNTFKVLSNELEEKKAELNKRDQYLKKNQKELILKENKLKEIEESLNKNIKKFTKSADEFGVRSNKNNITKSINSLPIDPYLEDEDFKQMEKGKVDVLKDILEELLFQGDFQSSFLIDGQGMIISEYSKTELDSLAVGAMFSLVCTTVLRTVQSLSLNELEYFKLSSLNGEFLLRNIEIKNYERNFILLAYYNESNSNIPVKKQVLSKKIIKKILKDLKRDFYDSRRGSGISWVFDNISEKLDFLKQKYNTIDGDIDLIRLNLVNKASIKIRELFEM